MRNGQMNKVMLRLADEPFILRQDNSRRPRRAKDTVADEPMVMVAPHIPSLVQSLEGDKPDGQIAVHFGVRIGRIRALRRYYGFQR